MLKLFTPVRKTAALLFVSLTLCYMALAPGTASGRGYVTEELESGMRMLEVFNTWVKGRTIPPMIWARHGPIPIFLDLPFIKLGKFLVSPDFVLSLEPVVLTAALVTILFLWLRKLCCPRMSILLSLTCAFGTLLWPYAYIGLETKQSLFIMLAGFMALANGKIVGWSRILLFSLVCGLAMTVKSTGVVLWPAIAYLLFVQFRSDWRPRLAQLLGASSVIAGIVAIGSWSQKFYWEPLGGGANSLLPWLIKSPLQLFTNAIGLFGSPTKGILVYAPILIVSLAALPRSFERNRDLTVFAGLVTVCIGGFLSLLTFGSDEVWGSRYMHITITPLILCIGSAWPRFEWRKHTPIVLLAAVGVMISFLGAFYYYGVHSGAMGLAGQNTMEWINGDGLWNAVTLYAHLFHLWMMGGNAPDWWTPAHIWVWTPPAGAQPWVGMNLRDLSSPQSFVLGNMDLRLTGEARTALRILSFACVAGPLLLLYTVIRNAKED